MKDLELCACCLDGLVLGVGEEANGSDFYWSCQREVAL
jgi:hypothetical protein